MNFLRRLFLVLFGLLLIAAGSFVLACYINDTVLPYWTYMLSACPLVQNLASTLIFAAIFIIIGAFVIFLGCHYRKAEPLAEIMVNDYGPVNISLSAVDNIIKTTAMKVTGVLGVKTRLKALPGGISVNVLVSADQAVNIPEVIAELQKAVKDNLEAMVGVKVAEIRVLVSEVHQKASGGGK